MSISNIENEGPVIEKPEVSDNPLNEFKPKTDTPSTTTSGESAATSTTDTKPTKVDDSPKDASPTITQPGSASAPSKDEFLELLLDKIEPIDKIEKPKLKALIYSEPGAGKTTLAGQIPNSLIIDSEKGVESILVNPELMAPNVYVLPYKTFEGLERTIEEFHKKPEQLANIETMIIDTISNLHKRGLAEVTEREWEVRGPSIVNRYVPETEHHGENNEHIRRVVQSMIDLDMNIILMAHSRTIEGNPNKGTVTRTFPDFSEKLSNTLTGMMNVVGYMYITEIDEKEHRVIKFHPGNGIIAKSRKGFPDNLVDPTWEKIEAILNG